MVAVARSLMASRGCCCSTSPRSGLRPSWQVAVFPPSSRKIRRTTMTPSCYQRTKNARMGLSSADYGYVLEFS